MKSVIRIVPIWSTTIAMFVCMVQLNTFLVLQAVTMDRHIGNHFQIPATSFAFFSMLWLTLFLPIYEKLIMPFSRPMTKEVIGITILQRMWSRFSLTTLSMALAAIVETKHWNVAVSHGLMEKPRDVILMLALWLVPQYSLSGLVDVLGVIGLVEFLYCQFPETLRSVGGVLVFLSMGVGSYLSSLLVEIVHDTIGSRSHHNWLAQNMNKAQIDNFYWLITGYVIVNLVYFIIIARWYRYKATIED